MEDITLYNGNSLKIPCSENSIDMIYFDPPFNSKREYKMSIYSEIGFNDKWQDEDYENFINENIKFLKTKLKETGLQLLLVNL